MEGNGPSRVLYVIVCGSPVARHVGTLIELARAQQWDVCLVATPDGRKFIDVPALAALTGHPVRTTFKNPGDPDVHPDPTAIIVAPATVNTINKWSVGIADTLALGLLIEGQGREVPIVALPYTNAAMGAHPAFLDSIRRLRGWGVTVLFGQEVVTLHPPKAVEGADTFPWELTLTALAEVGQDRAVRW